MTLKDELVAVLEDREKFFNMAYWVRNVPVTGGPSTAEFPSCETASCLAGWICALRPALHLDTMHIPNRARDIWETEMGERCRLDFHAINHTTIDSLDHIRRSDAIAHVLGEHPEWPLLK